MCAPAVNIGGNSIFSQLGTPTMLQSSHLSTKPAAPSANTNTAPAMQPPFKPPPVIGTAGIHVGVPQPSSLPPISLLSAVPADSNMPYGRTNSCPPGPPQAAGLPAPPTANIPAPPTANIPAPPAANIPAPPVEGFYGRSLNSPLNSLGSIGSSPAGSGPSSPLPKNSAQNTPLDNDMELLTQSVEKLMECKDKCACVLTNKNSEDISKKVDLFKNAWSQGRLSNAVKVHMSTLSGALEKRDFGQADNIHRTIVRSHPNEVSSWQVGVKKLISSYQKVVEENNKY